MLREEMFLTKVLSLIPGLQCLWSAASRVLLSCVIMPVLLTSNAVTVVVMSVHTVPHRHFWKNRLLSQKDYQVFQAQLVAHQIHCWNLRRTSYHQDVILTPLPGSSLFLEGWWPSSEVKIPSCGRSAVHTNKRTTIFCESFATGLEWREGKFKTEKSEIKDLNSGWC